MALDTDWPFVRVSVAIALVCLSACSAIDETASAVLSSRADAAGVFAGRVLRGSASFANAHQASVQLQSDDTPRLNCFGTLRFTATTGGVAAFSCSDGQSVSIPFQSLSPLRGSGRMQVDGATFALTYGLQPAMAAAYLAIPAQRLARPAADPSAKTVAE